MKTIIEKKVLSKPFFLGMCLKFFKGSKWNRGKKYSKAEQFDELFEPEVIDLEPKSEDYSTSLRNDVEDVIEKLPTDESPGSTRTVSNAAKKKLLGLLESPVMRSPEKHMGSGEGIIVIIGYGTTGYKINYN